MHRILACIVLVVCFAGAGLASSHSEAPGTAKTPNADISDFYVFQSYEPGREDYTVLILNAYPIQVPYGGPNYFSLSESHFYEIYIDNNGDAVEDITFQFYYGTRMGGQKGPHPAFANDNPCAPNQTVITSNKYGGIEIQVGSKMIAVPLKALGSVTAGDNSALNWFEQYQINYIEGDRTKGRRHPIKAAGTNQVKFTKPFDYAGTKTFPNYPAYADQYIYNISIPKCDRSGRVFVGQRKEGFAVNLGQIFDLINLIPIPNFPGAVTECDAKNNALININVHSFALEIPTECLALSDYGGVIGAWSGVRLLHHDGDHEHVPGDQVSRLGNPLVNEVVIGLRDKAFFSAFHPTEDGYFLDYVEYPTLPEIINILFLDAVNEVLNASLASLAPSNLPRTDLVATFLTGFPGLNQAPNSTACEYIRLNTSVPPTPMKAQNRYGVVAGDPAGFPNGRRPGDDVVDVAIQVVMGKLCYLPLGLCEQSDAPVGGVQFTDGAPTNAQQFLGGFPFLQPPNPGATTDPDPSSCPTTDPYDDDADEAMEADWWGLAGDKKLVIN